MFLGQILRHSGFCSSIDILEALDIQKKGDNRKLGVILIELNRLAMDDLEKALQIQSSIRKSTTPNIS